MYTLRITTTVEQLDFDGRVMFMVTDSTKENTINEAKNTVDPALAFRRGAQGLTDRIVDVLNTQYGTRS
jgi:hypothetical protein